MSKANKDGAGLDLIYALDGKEDEKGLSAPPCYFHKDERAITFCSSCSQALCLDCTIGVHNDHSRISVDKAIKEKQEESTKLEHDLQQLLSAEMDKLKVDRASRTAIELKLADDQQQLAAEQQDAKQRLQAEFQARMKKLDEDFDDRKKKLAATSKANEDVAAKAVSITETRVQELKDAVKSCRGIPPSPFLPELLAVLDKARQVQNKISAGSGANGASTTIPGDKTATASSGGQQNIDGTQGQLDDDDDGGAAGGRGDQNVVLRRGKDPSQGHGHRDNSGTKVSGTSSSNDDPGRTKRSSATGFDGVRRTGQDSSGMDANDQPKRNSTRGHDNKSGGLTDRDRTSSDAPRRTTGKNSNLRGAGGGFDDDSKSFRLSGSGVGYSPGAGSYLLSSTPGGMPSHLDRSLSKDDHHYHDRSGSNALDDHLTSFQVPSNRGARAPNQAQAKHAQELPAGNKKIVIYQADITTVNVNIIVSPVGTRLEHFGGVANAIYQAAGKKYRKAIDDKGYEMKRKYEALRTGEVFLSFAYDLPYSFIYHVASPLDLAGLKMAVEAVLQEADRDKSIKAVAIPAIGTGQGSMKADVAAPVMVQAAVDFPCRYLQEIHLVDFNPTTVTALKWAATRIEKGTNGP